MDLTYYLLKTQEKFRKRNLWFTRDRLFYQILVPLWKFITLCLFIVIKEKKNLTRYSLVRLYITYYQKNLLLTKGIVVWGHIVQANSLLFPAWKKKHSAAIIYSFEPIFNSNLSQLSRIAWEYELKDRQLEHPEVIKLKAIAFMGYDSGQQALNNSIFERLISLRESKAYQIVFYFINLRSEVQTISTMPSILSAMKEFKEAYRKIKQQPIS